MKTKRKKLIVFLMGFWVLIAATTIEAQDHSADKTIYVFSTVQCPQNSESIVDGVRTNLELLGYTIELTTADEIGNISKSNNFLVMFNACFAIRDGEDQITISIVAGKSKEIEQISPILFQTFDLLPVGDAAFPVDSQIGIEFAVNYLTGAALYAANRCQDATPFFESALQTVGQVEPENGIYYGNMALEFYLGNCALVAGNYTEAISHYENGIVNFPPFWDVKSTYPAINLSWVYLHENDTDNAFETADFALSSVTYWASVTPSASLFLVKVLSLHAQLNMLASRFSDALVDLDRAIQFSTNPEIVRHPSKYLLVTLYDLRGQAYRALYEWDSALADFNSALELDPAYAEAYYQRGLLYASILQTGAEFYDEALADFQHYLELAPEGEHAAEAAQYITDLQSQQQSLNE